MAPGIALDRCKTLRRQLSCNRVHTNFWIYKHARSVTEDCLSPPLDRQRALNEPTAKCSGQFGFVVGFDTGMITKHFKALTIELAEPAFDRNFPVRMTAKISTDDA